MIIRNLAIVLICTLVVPAGWARNQSIELTDDRGATLRLSAAAHQPAAISTFGADVSLALGVVPVAVTDYGLQGVPEYLAHQLEGVPTLGPRHQPNLEILSKLSPDLVIAIRRYTEKDGAHIESIAPLLALNLISLEDSLRAVELTGRALGAHEKAIELNAEFLDRIKELAAASKGSPVETVALLTSGSETPFIYYDHFLATALLKNLGFNNVGGALENPEKGIPLGYRISLEALLELNPDVILMLPTSRQRAFTMNPVWPYLAAVRNDRVFEVPHYWKEGAGPIARRRILDDIERLLLPDPTSSSDN
ncbi:ABC transporter substrate-binding protein [Marinobacter sp. AL4B]|uniref:ABC transporter substrate-binding protein n=1 Tax=Marinobacter sp. AL4B TaxID=2871173 RepID=UPI0021CD190C|nr:ABC transporter substrate-binding protein [Marinobacter sp. AL4B]